MYIIIDDLYKLLNGNNGFPRTITILRKKLRHVIPAKGLENICSDVKDKNKRTNL